MIADALDARYPSTASSLRLSHTGQRAQSNATALRPLNQRLQLQRKSAPRGVGQKW
jgi:hypothetical protein